MDTQQAVVDQIVQNLAFDIEAVPKNKSIQATSISKSAPLNLKIKVRKKDEIQKHNDVSWIADDTSETVQKVRLVNSDHTIMAFDVFMEAEFEKKTRKPHKHFFGMLRPGKCLRAVDDDKCPYMPSSSYSTNITEPTKATKSDGTFKQTFTLSKNVYQDYSVSTQQAEPKWLFGKCKPGGCLDPPFSEDKYSYKPNTKSRPEREEENLLDEKKIGSDVCNKQPVITQDDETRSNGRHSSIFEKGVFKKKRRSSDKSTKAQLPDKTDTIVDIYQGKSVTNSSSTRSNSIITYPPKTKSILRLSDDKTIKSRDPSEDKPRKSFNDHSEPCFIPPKGVLRIKEKYTLDPSDYPKHESSDVTEHLVNESFKMHPSISIAQKPKDFDINDDILTTEGDNANVTELTKQESQEQEKGSATPQLTREKSATTDVPDKPLDSSKTESFSSKVEQPTAPNELGDKNIKEPFEEIYSENNMEDTGLPNKDDKIYSPIPIPVPIPFNVSDPTKGGFSDQESDTENQENDTVAKPPVVAETQEKRNSKLEEITESMNKPTKQNDIKDDDTVDKKDETKPQIIAEAQEKQNSKLEEITESMDTPAKQNDIRDDDTVDKKDETKPPIIAEAQEKQNSMLEEITESMDTPAKQNDIRDDDTVDKKDETKPPITAEAQEKQNSMLEEITESMDTPAKQNDIRDDDTVDKKDETKPPIIAETQEKRNSKSEEITERIDKPIKQNDIKDDDTVDKKDKLKKGERKDTQRLSQSKLTNLKDKRDTKRSNNADKNLDIFGDNGTDLGSLLSESKTSIASVKDNENKKRSVSPGKYLDNVGERYTDLGVRTDKKRTSLPSGPKHETDFGDGKIMESVNNGNIDSYTKSGPEVLNTNNVNFIVGPIIIDNIKPSPKSGKVKEVDSEANIHAEPVDRKYDPPAELIPSTPAQKHTERISLTDKRITTGLPSIQSTSTLKTAMKNDAISVDLGFHSYLNDKNERILRTFDAANSPKRLSNDSVTVIKTQMRMSSNEIRIPVDSENDMYIQIKKSNANQRVYKSESGFVSDVDSRGNKQKSPAMCNDAEKKSSEAIVEEGKDSTIEMDAMDDHYIIDYYEQELVPLQLIIKDLRNEIDVLAEQQVLFKDKLACPNKSMQPRLVHANKKCYECVRK